jgi:glycosyltransferase involved in cell wall biosynthesis
MRIGLALYGSLAGQSGGFRYDRRLVDSLRATGATVEVIELPWRRYPRGLLDNCFGSVRVCLDREVDLWLQDELAHPSLLRANRGLEVPVVGIVHHLRASEPRLLAPVYRRIERQYLQTLDGVVCNSHATRDSVTALGVSEAATLVAPPAGDRFDPEIDPATIRDRATRDPLSVVALGTVEPRKGQDTLLDALARVSAPWELTIIGRQADPRYRRALDRQIESHGLGEQVELSGELPDEAVRAELRAAHLLALPSRYEGFGIAYLEGMSFGLPAIATTAGGAAAVVTAETGALVEPGDVQALAEAIETYANDRERLAQAGVRARRRYESHPGWAETGRQVREFLDSILDGE